MQETHNIRSENPSDLDGIEAVTIAAFKNHPYSNQKAHLIIAQLRAQGSLTVSLVAEAHGRVIGHVAFSEVSINGEYPSVYGLGPVSVDPAYQHQGVGSQLIRRGLDEIRKMNAKGCVLLGEPEYYQRFGFTVNESVTLAGVPPEHFLSLSFDKTLPSGEVNYHEAFTDNG